MIFHYFTSELRNGFAGSFFFRFEFHFVFVCGRKLKADNQFRSSDIKYWQISAENFKKARCSQRSIIRRTIPSSELMSGSAERCPADAAFCLITPSAAECGSCTEA